MTSESPEETEGQKTSRARKRQRHRPSPRGVTHGRTAAPAGAQAAARADFTAQPLTNRAGRLPPSALPGLPGSVVRGLFPSASAPRALPPLGSRNGGDPSTARRSPRGGAKQDGHGSPARARPSTSERVRMFTSPSSLTPTAVGALGPGSARAGPVLPPPRGPRLLTAQRACQHGQRGLGEHAGAPRREAGGPDCVNRSEEAGRGARPEDRGPSGSDPGQGTW